MRRHDIIRRILSAHRGGGYSAVAAPPPAGVAPTITSASSFNSAENQTAIGTVVATGGGTMVYSIIGGAEQALMSINSSSGVLTWQSSRNYDVPGSNSGTNAYAVQVQAANGVSPAATQSITVNLTDVADIVPVVTAAQSFSVSESVSSGATVGTVLVTAGDSATTSFAIVSGNTGTAFAISSAGVVTTAAALDYATLSSYTLGVTATNSAGASSAVNVGVTVTAAVDWPSVVAFADYPNAPPIVTMTVPALRTPTLDPRMTSPHVPGGVIQTKLTRISDTTEYTQPATGDPWNNFGPSYALQQHWSKDGDMMLTRAILIDSSAAEQPHALYTALHIVDGNDYSYIAPCYDAGFNGIQTGSWAWSNTNNDEILFWKAIDATYGEPKLYKMVASTQVISVLKDFSGTYPSGYRDFKYTGEWQSRDGRYMPFLLQKSGGQWYIVVWDRTLDTIAREWTVSSDATSHNMSFGVSPLGTYMWTASFGGEEVAGVALAGGVNVFSMSTGSLVASLGEMNGGSNPIGHTGPNTDSDGNEIWVWGHGAPSAALNERGIVSWKMSGADGTSYTTHLPQGKYLGLDYLNHCVPGYVVWSDYPVPTNNSNYSPFPLRGQIIMLPLDGSGDIKLVTSSRIGVGDHTALTNNGYACYPWATPSRNGDRVFFKSGMSEDWSSGIPGVFHAYVASA